MFDTSAFINGAHHHYFLESMPSVWALVDQSIVDGKVIVPREVFREVVDQDDAVAAFVKQRQESVTEPSPDVQRRAGQLQSLFPKPGLRDRADPFVMAEAELRGFAVVTYEGITFSGAPAKGAEKKLPGICAGLGIPSKTLSQALQELGLNL